jgi:hypothetical protein
MALSFLLVQYAIGEILVLAFFIPYGVGWSPTQGSSNSSIPKTAHFTEREAIKPASSQ